MSYSKRLNTMITFRGTEEEEKVVSLAKLLRLDKSEVIRRAVNSYYDHFQDEFRAYEWLEGHLQRLPGSGRQDVSERRKELLDEIYATRTGSNR